jgi:DNA-directed RNA polymerase specialized sigma24 family protein
VVQFWSSGPPQRPKTPKKPIGSSSRPCASVDPRAREALVERYLPLVQRLVAGAMGVETDLVDVVQDVFVAVLEGVHKLKDPSALQSWIASLAVFTARGRIRRKRRWRWIMFSRRMPPDIRCGSRTATPGWRCAHRRVPTPCDRRTDSIFHALHAEMSERRRGGVSGFPSKSED